MVPSTRGSLLRGNMLSLFGLRSLGLGARFRNPVDSQDVFVAGADAILLGGIQVEFGPGPKTLSSKSYNSRYVSALQRCLTSCYNHLALRKTLLVSDQAPFFS